MEEKKINVYIESNPNPNSLKFVTNFMLIPEGENYDFIDSNDAKNSPLALELFKFKYIKRVFYMSNFITITKSEKYKWENIKESIKEFIKNYLKKNKTIIFKKKEKKIKTKKDSDVIVRIKNILDEYIRPIVEKDGGAVIFDSFKDGNLKVVLQGSCRGCPSASITLKYGIENIIKRIIPEVKNVESK
jgi:Fe-S cluster biogenesis protein NfuA